MNAPLFPSNYLYLDSVNLVVGARRDLHHPDWRIDFRRLYKFLVEDDCRSATMYAAQRDHMSTLLDSAYSAGFDVVLGKMTVNGEKGVDLAMALDIMEDACTDARPGDRFILVTGDGDFLPVVERLRKRKMVAEVAFWDAGISGPLKHAADRFIDLTPHMDFLGYHAEHYRPYLGNAR